MADRFKKNILLASGYFLASIMAFMIVALPFTVWTLGIIFIFGGVYVAIEETLEDSFCAELVDEKQHGMAFGVLATVNGAGDFVSSVMVGILWTSFGTATAFAYSGIVFFAGAIMAARVGAHGIKVSGRDND
jgi:MFS family permease